MTGRLGGCFAALTLVGAVSGCVAFRENARAPEAARVHDARGAAETTSVPIDYATRFVGGEPASGDAAFAERVASVLTQHPAFADATPGDGAPLHLEFTLTNSTNRLVAGLTGLVCGLSLTVLPAYARDDFVLVVEARANGIAERRLEYHDSVTTIMHLTAALVPRTALPRHVVQDAVDAMLLEALGDLDASGVLARAAEAAPTVGP